ncbi:MAG: SLC13/DASS family transporter [Nitrospirae bacterium]|nr:SLC13/DASS family transporter [Nitrospirota bacterium]
MIHRVRHIGLYAGPALFVLMWLAPPPEGLGQAAWSTAGVAVWMAVWWVTEAVPIHVTAMLPLAAFPLLGIVKAPDLGPAYGHPFIFLFMGGFMLARAIERWSLHERIALTIVAAVGVSPRRLVLGMMVATAFISLWISNTAATLIMLPIGMAIVTESALIAGTRVEDDPQLAALATALMLGVAYAASIGGIGTLVGTAPNVVFASQLAQIFPDAPPVTFLKWMQVGLPLVIVFVPLTWLYLTRVAFPIHLAELPGGRRVIAERLAVLPPMNGPERRVALVFLCTALGWVFRAPIDLGAFTVPGWSSLLGVEAYLHDATVAMVAVLALFVIPAGDLGTAQPTRNGRLLDWETAQTIPWGILVLFGGGLALAEGVSDSGLAAWIGGGFTVLAGAPLLVLLVVLCLVMTFLTEITSNTAVATLFMPVLAAMAVSIGENPVLFMLPAAICASCAFMLPVGTPPNAIVFGSGHVRIPQMARAGFALNLIGVVLVTALAYLVIIPAFGIEAGVLPGWAHGR